MTNMRFHLVAISGIILVVIIIFAASGKLHNKPANPTTPAEPVYVMGDKIVTVWEASWGLNCNEAIERERRFAKPGVPPTPEVPKNNKLDIAAKICNGKETCDITADDKTFGPAPNKLRCRPELDITYRCYDIDRPTMIHARFGEKITINCKAS